MDEHAGEETFYLLVSKIRLEDLEDLLKKHESTGSGQKPDIAAQILKEIKWVKGARKKFATKTERPVPIGVTVRSIKKQPLWTRIFTFG